MGLGSCLLPVKSSFVVVKGRLVDDYTAEEVIDRVKVVK